MKLKLEIQTKGHPSLKDNFPQSSEPSPLGKMYSISGDVREAAWETIREARQKWLEGVKAGDSTGNVRRSLWIGGAIAVYARITGELEEDLLQRLQRELPQPGAELGLIPTVSLIPDQITPHPGGQKVVAEEDPVSDPSESPIPEYRPEEVIIVNVSEEEPS